jgi:hypothetical protein
MADVFLCHNTADKEAVVHIAKRLQNEGISVWLDTFNLIPGERFTPKIEEALESCETIAIFVGKLGRGPYQNEELEFALNVRGTHGARIIPVLLPGATPDMITGLLANRLRVEFSQSLDEIEPLRTLVAGIRNIPIPEVVLKSEHPGSAVPTPVVQPGAHNPYRPLAVFDVTDHAYFCGRDQLTEQTVSRAEDAINDATRCFSIVGASGSGKSSLARAGVLWSLRQKHPDWTAILLEPGIRPHETLAERMLKLTRDQVDGLTLKTHGEAYLTDASMLQRSIVGALGSDVSKGRLILLVDQFEEVFTICESQKAREAFLANVLTAARDPSGKTLVLLCIRADFYENCAKTDLAEVLSRQQILVGPLKRDELRSAIQDPGKRAGFEVEPELVTCLVKDCEEQPSPLPLLQIVLDKLWQKRDPRGRLTMAAYEEMSFEGALNEHAESVYDRLLDLQKRVCQSVMLQLAEPLGDGRYTRRRAPVDSLLPGAEPKKDASFEAVKRTEAVLGVLSGPRARLVAVRLEGGTPMVEVAHESILRGWKRLASWLDQDSEFLTWKRRLRFDLADWKNPKTPGSYLTGGALDRARTWLKERPGEHTDDERGFIQASFRRRVLWRSGLAAAATVAVAVAVFGGRALIQVQRSQIQLEIDQAVEELAHNPGMAVLLAYDAAKHEQSRRTREVLQRAVQGSRPPLLEEDGLADIDVSPAGTLVAAAVPNKILVWSIAADPNDPMIWSPLRIKPDDPKQLAFDGQPTKVVVSPDSKLIAAGDEAGTVTVWSDGQRVLDEPFHAGSGIMALAFATDGHHLAIATRNKVTWWSAQTKKDEANVAIDDEVRSLAVTPDSSTVAAGMVDGSVHFWRPPANRWSNGPHLKQGVVRFISYSKDGQYIGGGPGLGRYAYRWMATDPTRAVPPLSVNEELMDSGAMDGEGRRIAAHTTSGSIAVFDAEAGRRDLYIASQSYDIFKVVINSAGTMLAAAAPNGVRIYELRDEALAARARLILRDLQLDARDCEPFDRVLKASVCQEYLKDIK